MTAAKKNDEQGILFPEQVTPATTDAADPVVTDKDKEEAENFSVPEETVPVYNVNDGVFGRDGGPYLDREQEVVEEIRRAQVENRNPDVVNPPPGTGVQAVTANQLIQGYNNTNLAGDLYKKFEGEITAPEKAQAAVISEVPQQKSSEEGRSDN